MGAVAGGGTCPPPPHLWMEALCGTVVAGGRTPLGCPPPPLWNRQRRPWNIFCIKMKTHEYMMSISIISALCLQCFRCDHNEVRTNNYFALRSLVEEIRRAYKPHCKLATGSDRFEVDVVNCPVPKPGKRFVCGTVRGTVTARWRSKVVAYILHLNSIQHELK